MAGSYTFYVETELFSEAISLIQHTYPVEVKKFMQKEGNKLKRRTLKKAESLTNRVTGNYYKGIKRGKYYKYEGRDDTIRVYAAQPAYHAHLIEYGHEIKKKKHGMVYGKTRAFKPFHLAGDEFQSTFESDCEKFVSDLCKPLE